MKARRKVGLLIIALVLVFYFASYGVASIRGEFVQVFTEANYKQGNAFVNKIAWEPSFIGHTNLLNTWILVPYWPLYILDLEYWHKGDNPFNSQYPLDPDLDRRMRQL